MTDLDLGYHNINLINCNELFADKISDLIIDHIYDLNLHDKKISNNTIRKIFFHHIIHTICEYILNSKSTSKSVIFFNNLQLPECSLNTLYKESECLKLIECILHKVNRHIPIRVYISKYSLDYFNHLLETKQGKGQVLLNDIKRNNSRKYDNYTFNKAINFTKQYDLTWLSEEYFRKLSTKFLILH